MSQIKSTLERHTIIEIVPMVLIVEDGVYQVERDLESFLNFFSQGAKPSECTRRQLHFAISIHVLLCLSGIDVELG